VTSKNEEPGRTAAEVPSGAVGRRAMLRAAAGLAAAGVVGRTMTPGTAYAAADAPGILQPGTGPTAGSSPG